VVDALRIAAYALRRPSRDAWGAAIGKVEGIVAASRLRSREASSPPTAGGS
jgi:hypothetical protein